LGFRAGARRSCRRTMSARSRFAWASRARGPREAAGGRRSCRFSRPANPCKSTKPFARLGMERHAVRRSLLRERILRKSAIFQRPAGKAAAALRASLRFFKCASWQGCASEGGQVRLRSLASTLSRSRSRPACQAAEKTTLDRRQWGSKSNSPTPAPVRASLSFGEAAVRPQAGTPDRDFPQPDMPFGRAQQSPDVATGLCLESSPFRYPAAGWRRRCRFGGRSRRICGREQPTWRGGRGRCATPRHPAAVRRNVSRT